jgi:hypothetical protein
VANLFRYRLNIERPALPALSLCQGRAHRDLFFPAAAAHSQRRRCGTGLWRCFS